MFQRPADSYQIDFDKIVPGNAKVLDVGAGNGYLGWLFKKLKPGVVIDGIEPSDAGAGIARPYYRNFMTDLFQNVKADIVHENYDYIILADVIEHISDPLNFLKGLMDGLSDGTKIILSIPNVAHYSVRLGLLNGDFRYTDSGLLEKTHVRFFTLETIEKMTGRLGVHMESLYYLKRLTPPDGGRRYKPGFWTFLRMLGDREAVAFQYLLVLGRRPCEKKVIERGRVPLKQAVRALLLEGNGFFGKAPGKTGTAGK